MAADEPEDRVLRRQVLVDEIAGIVLGNGLGQLALRGLAARLNTSGRMLLYYFGTKETLVVQVLERINARLGTMLATFSASSSPTTPGAVLAAVLERAQQPEIAPFMRVWTEVVARGARNEAPYDQVAAQTVGAWIAWIDSRLLPEFRGQGHAVAILSIVDGVTLLELARPGTTTQARALLPGLLDAPG